MITDFADFVTWMYVRIDDSWQQIGPLYARPGPAPEGSDAELLTMALVGACRAWATETNVLGAGRTYTHLFPIQPERRRFNRRRRNVMGVLKHIRQIALTTLDVAEDTQCVLDSLLIPVAQCHFLPRRQHR